MAKSTPRSSKSTTPVHPTKTKSIVDLLSKAERQLVESSVAKKLATFSEAEVKDLAARARALHDKWRGLLRNQARTTKASARGTAMKANARTQEKVGVLAEALGRLEGRMAEFAKAASTAVGRAVGGKTKGSKPSAKVAAKASSGSAARQAVASLATMPRRKKRAVSVPASARAVKAKTRKATAARSGQAIKFDRNEQRKASTAAKSARFKLEGGTRQVHHAAAATRRKQARRDSR